jgi:hypothetical protein
VPLTQLQQQDPLTISPAAQQDGDRVGDAGLDSGAVLVWPCHQRK